MKRLAIVIGTVCLLFMSAITIAGDMRDEKVLVDTDFVACLYAAGHMVSHGHGTGLYPSLGATDFYNEEFAVYTRGLLGKSDKTWLFHFSYPAIVAIMLAPYSVLPFRAALIAWQLLSVFSYFMSAYCFAKTQNKYSAGTIFLCSCAFLPVLQTMVVGQNSLVLGLLPLSLGYFFWQRENPLASGLVWSLVGLKPQLAIPVAAIAFTLLLSTFIYDLSKREVAKLWVGLIAGTILLHLIPCFIFGFETFPLWLNSVKLGAAAFGAEKSGYWQYHLFCSVPCVAIISLPRELWLKVRPFAFITGIICAGILSAANTRLFGKELPLEKARALLMFLSTPLIFIAAPHLLLYDSCLLLIPAWIAFCSLDFNHKISLSARVSTTVLILLFNAYLMTMLLIPGLPGVLWQQILVLAVTCFVLLFSVLSWKEISSKQSLKTNV